MATIGTARSSSWPLNRSHPTTIVVGELDHHLGLATAGALEHLKRVIAPVDDVKRCPLSETAMNGAQQIEIRQPVAITQQEQHRQIDREEMLAPLGARFARRVQRKPEEDQPEHTGKGPFRRCHRGHPAAHRLAAGNGR